MRSLSRLLLAGLLSASLIQIPATAATASSASSPLGVILQANHALVGDGGAANGATVFDGDRLATDAAGSLRVGFGSSQAYLMQKSSAVVHQATGGFSANLTGGTIVLSSAEGDTFHLVADGAIVRPGTVHSTVAQVTLVSATELVLTSRKGELVVSYDDEAKSIPEGTSYRMLIPSPDPQGPQGAGSNGSGGTSPSGHNSNKALYILLGGAAGGVAIGVWRAVISPSAP